MVQSFEFEKLSTIYSFKASFVTVIKNVMPTTFVDTSFFLRVSRGAIKF